MTGLCCRCQVRHDDWLCCAHGVEHRGDIGDDTLLGVQRPAEHDCPGCGRFRASTPCEHCGDVDSAGLADIGTLVLATVVGAILAACWWLGYHAGDWPKVLAGLALAVAGAFVLVWIGGQEQRSVDEHPASWSSRSPIRADHEPRRGHEPKEL